MPTSSEITFKVPSIPLLSHPERSILICFRFQVPHQTPVFDGGTGTREGYENAIVYQTKSCTCCLGTQSTYHV
jgi:hypothetical protein